MLSDTVQSVQVPLRCDAGDQPRLFFSSVGGMADVNGQRYRGRLLAANNDQLEYYIPDVSGGVLDLAQTTFQFQVIIRGNQWGAASGQYSDILTLNIIF